ncbi:MAG: Smr/MutS family protein [Metallibacterium scheffleri]|jgi:DNA-nicking Smr family endonuclease|uniref:Smr/MutS family protein n=1 Tax=Metallibacterium scheffleri TaxID=993689 RepID=UPI0026EAE913|nr:Smr/MutS family protein [Metallibacterium scheffleri]MCK9365546.1 Smr/MutS family protein [Metallibacterium scheffleri]
MSKRSHVDAEPEDAAQLFRAAVGPLRRLPAQEPPPRRAPPAPRARMTADDDAAVLDELLHGHFDSAAIEFGDELLYLRQGHSPRLLKRLRCGDFSVQDEIDLHHLRAVAAAELLATFLADSQRAGYRCIKIIHGKGLRSGQRGPVLKALTAQMLRRRADVIAFASARANQGGSGATLVLLLAAR